MKINRFIISLLLVLVLTFAASCTSVASNFAQVSDKAENTVIEEAKHYQTDTLHKVNVVDSNVEFVKDGRTDYQIVIPAEGEKDKITDELIVESAEFIVNMVQKQTHVKLQIVRNNELVWNNACKWIIIGCDDLFELANLTMPTEISNNSGYYIKTVGNSVFMKTRHNYGYQFAAISFLTNVLGYDYVACDLVSFSKDGSIMPTMEIIEQSDYEYKFLGDMTTNEAFYGMGFNLHGNILCNTDGVSSHNVFKLLPQEKFYADHHEWYSEDREQLCFTAGGNQESFEIMIDETVKSCMYWLTQNERALTIPLVMQDGPFWCKCDKCKAEKEKYGTDSAVYVKFANRVAQELNDRLAEEASKNNEPAREVIVLITPYSMAELPPVKLENGVYVPVDNDVILNKYVRAYIAPAYASYTRSFYHEFNDSVRRIVEGWQALLGEEKELFYWLYETCYSAYLYPYNSYESSIETFRYCYEHDGLFMYSTSQYNNYGVTGFSRFKDYIDARSLFDLNLTFDEIASDFFPKYFGDGAEAMRTMFDEIQLQLKYIDDEYYDLFDGQWYNVGYPENTTFWPKKMLERWISLTEEAYKAIEHYKDTDIELYKVYEGHIRMESISPRFIMLKLYSGFFGEEELKEYVRQLKADCAEFSISRYTESKELDVYFSSFGV